MPRPFNEAEKILVDEFFPKTTPRVLERALRRSPKFCRRLPRFTALLMMVEIACRRAAMKKRGGAVPSIREMSISWVAGYSGHVKKLH